MKSKRIVLWTLWLVLLPGTGLAAQRPPEDVEPDIVRLRFNWPENVAIGVSFASRQIREQPGSSSDMRVQGQYLMHASPHSQGLRVTQSGLETTLFESIPSMPPPVEALYRNLSSLSPDYIVSRDGELVGVVGLDQLAADVRSSMAPLLEGAPPEAAGVVGLVDQMLSEEVLLAQIQEDWNAMVGTWVGADFELGVDYSLEESVPVPMFPDMSIPMSYSFQATERVSCVDGGPEEACVVLRMESAPNEGQLGAFVERFVARLGGTPDQASVAIGQLSRVDTIELVAEPETLLPHALSVTMEVGGVSGLPSEDSPFRRYRETRYRFGY